MGQNGHFYLHVDPVWSLYNVGTSCILGRAPRTKETARFSLNLESWKKGTQWSGVGLIDIYEYFAG